jgi:hypothetical protein
MDLSELLTIYFLAGMGVLFFLPPLIVIAYKLFFRLGKSKTIGKVLSREKKYDAEAESYNLITTIEIFTHRGEKFLLEYGIGYGLRYLPAIGSEVTVYYDSQNPKRFQLASRGLWEISFVFILVGFLMCIPLIIYLFTL